MPYSEYNKISDPSDSGDVAKAKSIGRELGVRCIILGSAERDIHGKLEVVAHIYETEQDSSIRMRSSVTIGSYGKSLRNIAEDLANKIYVEFPLLVGQVVDRDKGKGEISIDLSHPKLKINMRLMTYDQETGEVKGRARITENEIIWEETDPIRIRSGDIVMTE
jgi:hypothetical protein